MRISWQRGQQTAEFALLIGVVALMAIAMQLGARRALQQGLRVVSDVIQGHFSASPEVIAAGESTTLRWAVPKAASCVASGGWSGEKPSSGTELVSGIPDTTTYTLACVKEDGASVTALAATVTVGDLLVLASQGSDEIGSSDFRRVTTTANGVLAFSESQAVSQQFISAPEPPSGP